MSRYLIFGFSQYNPSGGWRDYQGSSNTLDDAKNQVMYLSNIDFWQIVDTQSGDIMEGHRNF